MERSLLVSAVCLALVAVFAGCAQPAAPAASAASPPAMIIQDARPDTSFGAIETGPAAVPDVNATTAAAPKLVKGEWWKIQFKSGVFQDAPVVVRVVADVQPGGYVIGMPHEGWFKEAIVFHAPAFGDVNPDLSYDTHNVRFEPLRFPLVKGATWKTNFGAANMTVTVESADESTATIRVEPPATDAQPAGPAYAALGLLSPVPTSATMRLVYDARQHEVVKFDAPFGSWEVVAHGYGFTGWVTIPRGEHTAIDYGQFLPATPGAPIVSRSTTVQGGFNRLTLLHAIIPFGPGAYRIRTTSPNGTEFMTESIAGRSVTLKFYEVSKPDGEWKMEDVVGGPGATYTMGMAYHQYDVRLPDGVIRSDHAHPVIR